MFILSGVSALALYRNPRAAQLILSNRAQGHHALSLDRVTVPTARDAARIARELDLPLPIHALALDPRRWRHSKHVTCHLWSGPVPLEEVIHIDNDLYVCSPEFLFLQLCCRSDLENILMVGSEMASDYAPNPQGRHGLVRRPPLLTPDSIRACADTMAEAPGTAKARKLAGHLVQHAWSPKETEIALLLGLPRRLGGRGVSGIELNYRIDLAPSAQTIARRSSVVADLMILPERHVLEYNSNDFHLTRTAHESDERKRNALAMMGIELTTITAGQLHDWETFDSIAEHLLFELGRGGRMRTDGITDKQRDLWERLLFGSRKDGRTKLVGGDVPATHTDITAY